MCSPRQGKVRKTHVPIRNAHGSVVGPRLNGEKRCFFARLDAISRVAAMRKNGGVLSQRIATETRMFLKIAIVFVAIAAFASTCLAQGFDRPVGTQSTRSMVLGRRGMVCASQPLATEAGIAVLRRGGNAFDAAIAAAATLNVVEPMSTGIGGDAFVLAWPAKEKKLVGLNGSGRSSRRASVEHFRGKGHERIPTYGADAVTVPGAFHAWATLHARYGRLPLADVLADAIHYAEEGFPVSRDHRGRVAIRPASSGRSVVCRDLSSA